MARDANVRLNLPGINKVMKSQEVADFQDDIGQRIARAAGPGFVAETDRPAHKWVARTRVRASTREARAREAREDVLKRAIDAGRGR